MDSKRHSGTRRNVRGPSPRVVGVARNAFGTRLCQRVVCTRCQAVDYVAVKVNDPKNSLCRDCAEKFLAAYEMGRRIADKKLNVCCEQCHREFLVEERIAEKKEQLRCLDCLRGFEVWRGKAQPNRTPARTILTKTGSRTTLRKKADETI